MIPLPSSLKTPCCSLPPISAYSLKALGAWRKPEHASIPGADHDMTVCCSCSRCYSLAPAIVLAAEDASRRQASLFDEARHV